MRTQLTCITITLFVLSMPSLLCAADNKQNEMPPAQVVVADVSSGMIAPENEFIGTVYYREVSDVASEVSGKVEKVEFEEGRRVKQGHILVVLSSDLLEKSLEAARANYEEVLSNLEKARKDLIRAENLFEQELISEQTYDGKLFDAGGLEKKASSLEADMERLETELEKKAIKAPFDGIVLKKHTHRGEWLAPGSPVATIAVEDYVDIVAEISSDVVKHIKRGMDAKVSAGGERLTGTVYAIIPRGDISTRTFPVKVRVKNSLYLAEGMEARIILPTGKKEKALTVPRDAVITVFGKTVVYAVKDTNASMIPVTLVGYDGMAAGIRAEGLAEGMKVVVKGNERLRPGQPVMIQK